MTTAPTGTAGEAVQSAADLYINALRSHRDQLEITVAGLRHRLAMSEAEVAKLRARKAADGGQET